MMLKFIINLINIQYVCFLLFTNGAALMMTGLHFSFILAGPQEVNLNIEWKDQHTLNITCDANRIYPEPTIKLFIKSSAKNSIRYNKLRILILYIYIYIYILYPNAK